jgi:hypothetical protein
MRMLQPSRNLNFPPEALDVDLGRELWREHLHHNFPAERRFVGQEYTDMPPPPSSRSTVAVFPRRL